MANADKYFRRRGEDGVYTEVDFKRAERLWLRDRGNKPTRKELDDMIKEKKNGKQNQNN